MSPEPITYNATNIALNVTFNETVSWVRYSLDGKSNVTFNMNNALSFDHSLTELPEGKHNITFYACDLFGHNEASDNIKFMVVQETGSDPKGFSAMMLLATSPVVVVVAAGLRVYFKKHKR